MLSEKEKLAVVEQAVADLKLSMVGVDWEGRVLRGVRQVLVALENTEVEIMVTPGLADAEVHRFRGRVGMLRDLSEELEKMWREAQERKDSE